jgi:hypothetical protein
VSYALDSVDQEEQRRERDHGEKNRNDVHGTIVVAAASRTYSETGSRHTDLVKVRSLRVLRA